jgi:hypothetical protein
MGMSITFKSIKFGLPAYFKLSSSEVVPVVATDEAMYVLQQPSSVYKSTWEKSKISRRQFKPVDLLAERPSWVLSRIWRELKEMQIEGSSCEKVHLQDEAQQVTLCSHKHALRLNLILFTPTFRHNVVALQCAFLPQDSSKGLLLWFSLEDWKAHPHAKAITGVKIFLDTIFQIAHR